MTVTIGDVTAHAEAAVLELSLFFVRHSLPGWPAKMGPSLQALRAGDAHKALEHWAGLQLMGEYGLMETRVCYELGYRSPDFAREQEHFERLLQQALDGMNNLRAWLRNGSGKAPATIYPDTVLPE
jgi:hypothetical protein